MDEDTRDFLETMNANLNVRIDLILDQLSAMRADMDTAADMVAGRLKKIDDRMNIRRPQ